MSPKTRPEAEGTNLLPGPNPESAGSSEVVR